MTKTCVELMVSMCNTNDADCLDLIYRRKLCAREEIFGQRDRPFYVLSRTREATEGATTKRVRLFILTS